MTFRVLSSMLVLLAAAGSLRGDQPHKQDFAELKRLHSVLELSSFPSPSQNGIRFWFQKSVSHGTVRTVDLKTGDVDEFHLRWAIKFFDVENVKNLDLTNIAIISENGLLVRFVELEGQDTVVKHGDVVVFLLSEQIEAQRERRENSVDLGNANPAGILILHDVDAGSLLPFVNEIRSSCGEPKLTLGVDASKNAIVFQNSTSSIAETTAKLQRWIRNVEPGKLRMQ